MTAPPDDDTQDDDPGRAARRAERVEVLGDLIRAGRDLALQAAAASLAGTPLPAPDAHLAFLRACREVRQAVSLQARLDGDPAIREDRAWGRPDLDPGSAVPGLPHLPGKPPENPRLEHVRRCVRLVIDAIPPERDDPVLLRRLLDERLVDPDIHEDLAEGRDPELMVEEVCEDLAIAIDPDLTWPEPPDWTPRQPPGAQRALFRDTIRSTGPPEPGGG